MLHCAVLEPVEVFEQETGQFTCRPQRSTPTSHCVFKHRRSRCTLHAQCTCTCQPIADPIGHEVVPRRVARQEERSIFPSLFACHPDVLIRECGVILKRTVCTWTGSQFYDTVRAKCSHEAAGWTTHSPMFRHLLITLQP